MKTRVIFLRHGETDGNVQGIVLGTMESALTERGRAQAKERAQTLKALKPYKLFSSTLWRGTETTVTIAKELGFSTFELDMRLCERFVGAKIQGLQQAQALALVREEWGSLRHQTVGEKLTYRYSAAPDAETPLEAAFRLISFINDVGMAYKGKTLVAVTHAAVLASLLVRLGEIPFEGPFGGDAIDHLAMFAADFNTQTRAIEPVTL